MKHITNFTRYLNTLSRQLGVYSNWQRALTSSRSMIGYLNRLPILLLGSTGRTWLLGIVHFCRYALLLKKTQGYQGLAKSLKVSHVCLMKACAGDPVGSSWDLGHPVPLTGSRIPRWIPSIHRRAIRAGDPMVIRFWLSVCSLYRVIDYKATIDITTITAPGRAFNVIPYLDFVPIFFSKLGQYWVRPVEVIQFNAKPLMIAKAGPGSQGDKVCRVEQRGVPIATLYLGNTTAALALQAAAWMSPSFQDLRLVLKRYCTLTGMVSTYNQLENLGKEVLAVQYRNKKAILGPFIPAYLGKLGFKDEPGKVRVFAMVDWWTQVLMHPLHTLLFSILKRIPNDGTMDQDAAVRLGLQLLIKKGFAASFDIKAATDRIPGLIQAMLVNYLLPCCGQLWLELLVGREYRLGRRVGRQYQQGLPKAVRYSTGQPMGALSSWAMLALTHHFIVQLAAARAGHIGWFGDYLILGDDLVIFDREVAKQYLIIMEDLGVGIGIAKSLRSTDCFEFAKRYIFRNQALPMVSFRELDVSMRSLDALVQLLQRHRGTSWRMADVMKLKGFGFRAIGNLTKRLEFLPTYRRLLIVWLSYPGVSKYSFTRYIDWFAMTALGRSEPQRLVIQSLGDIIKALIASSAPEGSTSQLVPRDIYGPTGIPRVKHWRAENLDAFASNILWPLQEEYFASHREHDALRTTLLQDVTVEDLDQAELALANWFEWDTANSLTPAHVDVQTYTRDEVRRIAGKWLVLWSKTRQVIAR